MEKNDVVQQWLDASKKLLKMNEAYGDISVQKLCTELTKQVEEPPRKIEHIGIAVSSINEALPFYVDGLKLKLEGIEEVPSQKVRVAFLKIGQSKLELLEPTDETSPIQQFILKKGEGIHHIALAVNNIENRLNEMKEKGFRLINETPVVGAANALVAFVHPKSAHGVLYEFCEKKKYD